MLVARCSFGRLLLPCHQELEISELASSKSKQSAAKLLTAKYRNFFECDAEPHELANSIVAHLKELSEEQNCWVAELLLDLTAFEKPTHPQDVDTLLQHKSIQRNSIRMHEVVVAEDLIRPEKK